MGWKMFTKDYLKNKTESEINNLIEHYQKLFDWYKSIKDNSGALVIADNLRALKQARGV